MANEIKQDRFGDERLKKDAGQASRASRDSADVDRVTNDGSSLSDYERRRLLRQEYVQEILPSLPDLPGFHLCWVSTTSSVDTIHQRQKVGYLPVRISELKGFDQFKIDGGQYDGCVACNEMLLMKLPMQVYQDLMAIYHHDMPLEQEQAIRDRVNGEQYHDSADKALVTVEGEFNQLGRPKTARTPTFA